MINTLILNRSSLILLCGSLPWASNHSTSVRKVTPTYLLTTIVWQLYGYTWNTPYRSIEAPLSSQSCSTLADLTHVCCLGMEMTMAQRSESSDRGRRVCVFVWSSQPFDLLPSARGGGASELWNASDLCHRGTCHQHSLQTTTGPRHETSACRSNICMCTRLTPQHFGLVWFSVVLWQRQLTCFVPDCAHTHHEHS